MRYDASIMRRTPALAIFAGAACLLLIAIASGCGTRTDATPAVKPRPAATTAMIWNDSDGDGIPDGIELSSVDDRDNFRHWFTGIAEMQYYEPSGAWNAEQRDCSGLVRFAWREALRRHDRAWFLRMGPDYEPIAPEIQAYNLEQNPLAERIFRTAAGAFRYTDKSSGAFSEFADARTLKSFNTVFVSRDRRQAEPGDLLFFYQPWVQKYPFHVMLFIGKARVASEGASDWVVYHTGSSPGDAGMVKKVRLTVLDNHPDPRWRPVEGNEHFLGFYRLKILN